MSKATKYKAKPMDNYRTRRARRRHPTPTTEKRKRGGPSRKIGVCPVCSKYGILMTIGSTTRCWPVGLKRSKKDGSTYCSRVQAKRERSGK